MKETIHFSLLADSLSIEGLSVADGKLRLALCAEIELSALQEGLREELCRLTGRALIDSATGVPMLSGLAAAVPEPLLARPSTVESEHPSAPFILSHAYEKIEPEPGVYLTPHEHFFPEPDDDTLLAEEDEALGIERDVLPAASGTLFGAEDLPTPLLTHYFPEPAEELVGEEDFPIEPLAGYDELATDEEYGELREVEEADNELVAPAVFRPDMPPALESEEDAGFASAEENPEGLLLAGAVTPDVADEAGMTGPDLEENLTAPAERYGEPVADIEWSALLSDRHSDLASATRPTETPASDASATFFVDPKEDQGAEETGEVEEWTDSDESNAEEPEESEEPGDEELADEEDLPESDEDDMDESDGYTLPEPEGAVGEQPVRPVRSPLTLINPKLHNEEDAPDDTPPGVDEVSPRQKAPLAFSPLDGLRAPAPLPVEHKARIKYVCPKCHTPGQQDLDRLGSVVTCANCGRAMRLTMKK